MANVFTVNPEGYDKRAEFTKAISYVGDFLDKNGIKHPSKIEDTLHKSFNAARYFGCYNQNTRKVYVNLKKTRPPVKTPGWAWSFTGFKADLTAPGILAHEVGHHVHNMIENNTNAGQILRACATVATREPNVSNYEPNHKEMLAEAFRLFIMNPMLLAEGRPLRYDLITRYFGLKPLHEESWKEVLKHAHPKLISAGESWIRQSR